MRPVISAPLMPSLVAPPRPLPHPAAPEARSSVVIRSTNGEVQFEEAKVEKSQVHFLGGQRPQEVSPQDLSGFGWTYRHNWGPHNGWWILVLASNSFGPPYPCLRLVQRGSARQRRPIHRRRRHLVISVAPDSGLVSIRVFIDWPSPIGLVVDHLFVNPL